MFSFDYTERAQLVIVDLSDAELWDASTVVTLNSISRKYEERGVEVRIEGLDDPSLDRLDHLSGRV
ncbi:hypothetical protein CHUV2995_00023 [Corynebacterium diphtheriae subsp. lausannense]|nr:hypothetical protein CHUV2995_00023 [Corynebacterium diphtheriae subsp. lausannense]